MEEYKAKDPIEHIKDIILKEKYADEAWVTEIEEKVKSIVDESVKFAEESPWPQPEELFTDIYVEQNYPFQQI